MAKRLPEKLVFLRFPGFFRDEKETAACYCPSGGHVKPFWLQRSALGVVLYADGTWGNAKVNRGAPVIALEIAEYVAKQRGLA